MTKESFHNLVKDFYNHKNVFMVDKKTDEKFKIVDFIQNDIAVISLKDGKRMCIPHHTDFYRVEL